MLRADRLCIYILIFGFIMLIPSAHYIKFIDELCALMLGSVAILDCLVNNNWKRYTSIWVAIAIMSFYAVYSIVALDYNTTRYILMDWIIELKPYIPFFVMFSIVPALNEKDKAILKIVAYVNSVIVTIAFILGRDAVIALIFHPTYAGLTMFMSAMLIILLSVDKDGGLPKKELVTAITILTIGLACTRSKYYGIYVIVMFFMFLYKPGMTRNLSARHFILIVSVLVIFIAVAWQKFSYYFLTGNSDSFDPETIETFARPVLYVTGGLIFIDHFPFGTGLASFATYPSQISYSNVYYEYGIDKVWGLSPSKPDFICDAFFPSLAQFGILGVIIFIYFWVYCYSFLKTLIRTNPVKFKYPFIVGSSIICFILIECTSGNTFTQPHGFLGLALLGIICGNGKLLKSESHVDDSTPSTIKELSPRKI